ncbi:alpha/beta hydrolase family protein [Deinococcus roseus]|uniref:Alpha/beta hydrolase n=1 Tax=Deinococcus roseus TaxID=392414 RepID=A0ABQ2D1G2_9DEIO|nr:alpha/beta fold hydrolase [Deinococcus roseus]GGJ30380.1 alpha/beta hydrolase [Deinococcus roseus]
METWATFAVGGQKIHGMLHLPDTPRPEAGFPSVVFLHGFTGSRSEHHRLFVLLARRLAQLGVAALRFDYRGNGDSEGDFSEMTVTRNVEDAVHAAEYLRNYPGIDPLQVRVLGFSMGGLTAILAAAGMQAERLLLWAPAAPEGMMRMLNGKIPATTTDFGGWPLGRNYFLDLAKHDSRKALAAYAGPVLILQGEKDEAVPPKTAIQYAENSRADLVVLPDADHIFGSFQWTDWVFERSIQFLI